MARTRIGSETQWYARAPLSMGIDRVVRETHRGLDPRLLAQGIELVPLHTRDSVEAERARAPYFASDRVLSRPVHAVEQVDAVLLLGMTMTTDFGSIHRERQRRRLPIVAVVHDVLPIQRPEWFVADGRRHFRSYLQQLLRVTDDVVVASRTVLEGLTSLGWRLPEHLHVCPLGTSFAQHPPTRAPSAPIGLLYVSTVAPHKGHGVLLDALDDLLARGVNVRLTLVGRESRLGGEVADRIRRHPESGRRLRWEQSADDARVEEIARDCRVAVVPPEDEGFGLTIEEALSLGLHVVASDIPVFRERAYPNLTLVPATGAQLAQEILTVAEQPPVPLATGTIRSMDDFAADLTGILLDALDR